MPVRRPICSLAPVADLVSVLDDVILRRRGGVDANQRRADVRL